MRALTEETFPVKDYIEGLYGADDALKLKAREFSRQLSKERISLSPVEARLLATVIATSGAKKFVEIGTLTGYSALWILDAVGTDGKLWTFEKDAAHAAKAREIFSGKNNVVLMEGDAEETLPKISGDGPFDGIFLDGNKGAYGRYLDWAEKNLRQGGLIVADNVFLGGSVHTGSTDEGWSKSVIETMRTVNRRLADRSRYFGAIVPTSEGLFVAKKLF
jgi:predicted O-methyltransferase YrrM